MRLTLVWRRPAVSASTRSAPRAAARCTASKMTELGSPPSAPRTRSAPARSAHVSSCSAAAARNVSPAAITTVWPASACRLPTLPIVVVLPTPFTPDEQPHVGRARLVVERAVAAGEVGLELRLQRLEQRGRLGDAVGVDGGPQAVEDVGGGGDADVGDDQRLLEVVPRLVVDLVARQDGAEVARHRAAGLAEPVAERAA